MKAVSRGGWSRHHRIVAATYAWISNSATANPATAHAIQRTHRGRRMAIGRLKRYWPLELVSSSPFAKVQVRVIVRMSVSRLMSGGNGAYGADISTILTAAASRIRCIDLWLTSTFSRLPSLRIDTV